MKKAGLIVVTGVALLSSIFSVQCVAAGPQGLGPMQLNLPPVRDWRSQIKGDSLSIADGITFRVRDYLEATSFRNSAKMQRVFSPAFQQRFLKRPVQYSEDVSVLSDRVLVKRTLLIDAKDPCDQGLKRSGINVCFQPASGQMSPETVQYLADIRAKINKFLEAQSKHPAAAKYAQYSKLSDRELLDQLLNKDNTTKIIVHESAIPRVVYKFGRVPENDLFDVRRPISRANMLRSINEAAQPALIGATRVSRAPNTRVPTGLPGQGNNVAGKLSEAARGATPAAPSEPYLFVNTRDMDSAVLTGWTVGREFRDRYSIQFAPETWITDRYYAEFSYRLSAGFGLRWPFTTHLHSEITSVYGTQDRARSYPSTEICNGSFPMSQARGLAYLCARMAKVAIEARAVDGDERLYRDVGIDPNQVFDGKEFVLKLGASCRLYASIPGKDIDLHCPSGWEGFDLGRNMSAQLGPQPKTLLNYTIRGRTIGLALDEGIGYAALNPGVSLTARNGKLSFDTSGLQARVVPGRIAVEDTPSQVTVTERNARGNWGVRFANPSYAVNVGLSPSMQVEVGVDLGVYAWTDTFGPVTIDSLVLDLGTLHFDRHAGTRSSIEIPNVGTRPSN